MEHVCSSPLKLAPVGFLPTHFEQGFLPEQGVLYYVARAIAKWRIIFSWSLTSFLGFSSCWSFSSGSRIHSDLNTLGLSDRSNFFKFPVVHYVPITFITYQKCHMVPCLSLCLLQLHIELSLFYVYTKACNGKLNRFYCRLYAQLNENLFIILRHWNFQLIVET